MNTVQFISYGRIAPAPPSCPPVSNYLMRPGRWRWLQRLCFWVLERLGCKESPHNPFPLPVVVPPMERITVNREQLVATLRDHLNELRRDEVRPVAVMMGPPQYKEAVQGFLSRPIVMVERFHVARNGLRLVEDLKVVLVPWMDGVVVLNNGRPELQGIMENAALRRKLVLGISDSCTGATRFWALWDRRREIPLARDLKELVNLTLARSMNLPCRV